jgi:hypothetical protein
MNKVSKKTKEFLLRKMTEKWMKENKGMLDDYYEICHKILMFKALWGIDIGIMLNTPKEDKGRQLGKGVSEELFNVSPQEYANKRYKAKK